MSQRFERLRLLFRRTADRGAPGDVEANAVPGPAAMPVDRPAWRHRLELSNFVNSYCQYRDIQRCAGVKSILIIGPGQGLDTEVFRWRGYRVTTLDVDDVFEPDIVGSVHDLSMFSRRQFDAVIASHVLEHIPVPYLERSLAEMARVAEYALIYLPVAGRHFQIQLRLDVKGIHRSLIADLFNYFHRPDGITRRYCGGQHYWELGMRGFRRRDILQRLDRFFAVHDHYRNDLWNPSYNFVLRSKSSS